jgi:hypothetical protein
MFLIILHRNFTSNATLSMQNMATARQLQSQTQAQSSSSISIIAPQHDVYGPTMFSDMSSSEFRSTRLTFKRSAERSRLPVAKSARGHFDVNVLPAEIDWRSRGAVTAVKV